MEQAKGEVADPTMYLYSYSESLGEDLSFGLSKLYEVKYLTKFD